MAEQHVIFNELYAQAGLRVGAPGSDYTLPSAKGTSGQVLKVDVTQNGVFSGIGLGDLSDVSVSAPSNKQLLQYNGAKWVNGTVSVPGTQQFTKVVSVPMGSGTTPLVTITFDPSTNGYAGVHIWCAGFLNDGGLSRQILDRWGTVRINSGTATWFGYMDAVTSVNYQTVSVSSNVIVQSIKQNAGNTGTVTVLIEVLPQQLSTNGFSVT